MPPCRLIQENDAKHTSDICSDAISVNNIEWIKIPPYSPDLNVRVIFVYLIAQY